MSSIADEGEDAPVPVGVGSRAFHIKLQVLLDCLVFGVEPMMAGRIPATRSRRSRCNGSRDMIHDSTYSRYRSLSLRRVLFTRSIPGGHRRRWHDAATQRCVVQTTAASCIAFEIMIDPGRRRTSNYCCCCCCCCCCVQRQSISLANSRNSGLSCR